MRASQPVEILVIDDDLQIGAMIRAAVPNWQVHTAYTGPAGLSFVRMHRSRLQLIVLDVCMPGHDGVKTCIQLRWDYPDLPIMPFTSADQSLPVLQSLGCVQPLSKKVFPTPEQLARHLQQALATKPSPLEMNPLVSYLHQVARESEQQMTETTAEGTGVALLAHPHRLIELREQIKQAGVQIIAESTQLHDLFARFNPFVPQALIVDVDDADVEVIAELAFEHAIPLLAVAQTMQSGYRACACANGVLVSPLKPAKLRSAIDTINAGRGYVDPWLEAPFREVGLSDKERAICIKIMQGYPTSEIAQKLNYQPQTIREYVSRIYTKFGLQKPNREQLQTLLNGWARHF